MDILLTGDLQAEWANLDLCKQAVDEITNIAYEQSLKYIGVLGDLKRHYNPVDMRVVKFWQRSIERWVAKNLEVLILLGNHDREGQHDDKQNWLEVLERAGAKTYDEADIVHTNSGSLYMVPWSTNIQLLKEQLESFAEEKHSPEDVLLFHQDVRGAKYNVTGAKSEAKLTVGDFHSTKYMGCFGGHIHLHQKVGERVYYVGSPFATDWGEANQPKGYVVIRGRKFRFMESSIPKWYDPTWPGFRKNDVKPGARLRIHPQIEGSGDHQAAIERARIAAESKYPGVTVFVKPEFRDDTGDEDKTGINTSDPDSVKIKAYVEKTVPDNLEPQSKALASYLAHKLHKAAGPVRSTEGIKFIKAIGKNVLSFKEVECDFRTKGITVVSGVNLDRPGKSNGAGKTSYLQLAPIAIAGCTYKGQKHDRWAKRNTVDTAYVSLHFKDARNRYVRVRRSRRPGQVRLWINKHEQSTGLRGDARDATQGLIESVSGFSWQTLANAIYIDQSVSRSFLNGTRSDRSKILSRFQNLERFEKALELVKRDAKQNGLVLEQVESDITDVLARYQEQKVFIADLKQTARQEATISEKKIKAAYERYKSLAKPYGELVERNIAVVEKLEQRLAKAEEIVEGIERLKRASIASQGRLISAIDQLEDLAYQAYCPTCSQPLPKSKIGKTLAASKFELKKFNEEQRAIVKQLAAARGKVDEINGEIEGIRYEEQTSRSEVAEAKRAYDRIKEQAEEASSTVARANKAVKEQRTKLKDYKRRLEQLAKSLKALKDHAAFYQYCVDAFSRDGIPAFLSMQLVPVLNREADYYSDLFSDSAIQVRFEVRNGEFDVTVVNGTGGADIDDQSDGERALAGLITSFALRSIAPRTNVLILDEPGAGLDSDSTRQFAAGLRKLAGRFGSIFITSHNSALLSELGEERTIVVEKRRGTSSVR